jgi:hypothetical protein
MSKTLDRKQGLRDNDTARGTRRSDVGKRSKRTETTKAQEKADTASAAKRPGIEKRSRKTVTTKAPKKIETARDARKPKASRGVERTETKRDAARPGLVVPRAFNNVRKEIVSRFPEMKGVRPSVVKRKVPADVGIVDMIGKIDGELGATLAKMKTSARKREIYCASFEKKIKTSGGSVLQKIVRVTFDKEGHILKLVASK